MLRGPTEEKACGHGLMVGIRCAGCGGVRVSSCPPWHCVGSAKEEDLVGMKMLDERDNRER